MECFWWWVWGLFESLMFTFGSHKSYSLRKCMSSVFIVQCPNIRWIILLIIFLEDLFRVLPYDSIKNIMENTFLEKCGHSIEKEVSNEVKCCADTTAFHYICILILWIQSSTQSLIVLNCVFFWTVMWNKTFSPPPIILLLLIMFFPDQN